MSPRGRVVIELVTVVHTCFVDAPVLNSFAVTAESMITEVLHPWTRCSYLAGFQLFLAFITYMDIPVASSVERVIVYLQLFSSDVFNAKK